MKNDLISREALRTALVQAFGCENATKYGNKNAEQQANSYSTYMLYEIADTIEDVIDNAPTVEERPQGEWEKIGEIGLAYKCNKCGEVSVIPTNFCPNCGADMRGEVNG